MVLYYIDVTESCGNVALTMYRLEHWLIVDFNNVYIYEEIGKHGECIISIKKFDYTSYSS